MEIIPGIFENSEEAIRLKIDKVATLVSWVQIDVADGLFVPNISVNDPGFFQGLIQTNQQLKFELHLMIKEPFSEIESWVAAGFQRFLIHYESTDHLDKRLAEFKGKHPDLEIGVALDKDTPVEAVKSYLNLLDVVLVMTIKAGFSGQKFLPELLEKVKLLKAWQPALPVAIDGGVDEAAAKLARQAGVDRLVTTSYIFSSGDIAQAIWKLQN